jgi:hypothetical protein
MGDFLKNYPQYSEFNYTWNLPVDKMRIMLADASRVDSKKANKPESKKGDDAEIVNEGSMFDFIGGSAGMMKKI